MESLLAAQFAGTSIVDVFENGGDEAAKMNVNLLLHLLNRKFYRTS